MNPRINPTFLTCLASLAENGGLAAQAFLLKTVGRGSLLKNSLGDTEYSGMPFDLWLHFEDQSAPADWSIRYPAYGWVLATCLWKLDEGIVPTLD
jgi:hypothetical protein